MQEADAKAKEVLLAPAQYRLKRKAEESGDDDERPRKKPQSMDVDSAGKQLTRISLD